MAKETTNAPKRASKTTIEERAGEGSATTDKGQRPATAVRGTDPTSVGASQIAVSNYSRRAAKPKPKAKRSNQAVHQDWRSSELTVFIMGAIIIGGVMELVCHYSPYKRYMALCGFVIGILYTAVFLLGGRDK